MDTLASLSLSLSLSLPITSGHEFHVPTDMLATTLKISVVYKGVFTARGYILGRLAVGLYRVPEPVAAGDDEGGEGAGGEGAGGEGAGGAVPPIPVGYSPASMCELNTPDGMGRIAIIHEPSAQYLPVRAGRYRIVVAAASKTGYSFTVMCTVGHHVPDVIRLRAQECTSQMHERPQVKQELFELTQSVRFLLLFFLQFSINYFTC